MSTKAKRLVSLKAITAVRFTCCRTPGAMLEVPIDQFKITGGKSTSTPMELLMCDQCPVCNKEKGDWKAPKFESEALNAYGWLVRSLALLASADESAFTLELVIPEDSNTKIEQTVLDCGTSTT